MKNILDRNVLIQELDKVLTGEITREEFDKFYYQVRDKYLENGDLPLNTRRKLHSFVVTAYKIINFLNGLTYEILEDKSTPTDRPVIYVPTHIGKFDIQVITVATRIFYTLLSGDFEHIQGRIDGSFLRLNGIKYFNEMDPKDRKKVISMVVDAMFNGDDIMWFMEGTWNVTPNLPMLPTYKGVIEAAMKGNAIIRPIAISQYGKHFKLKIGENFEVNSYGDTKEDIIKATEDLRDYLATMQYEIFETEKLDVDSFYQQAEGILNDYMLDNGLYLKASEKKKIIPLLVSKLKENYWKEYQQARFDEWAGFDDEYIYNLIYKPSELKKSVAIRYKDGKRLEEIKEHGKSVVVELNNNDYSIKKNSEIKDETVDSISDIVEFCDRMIKQYKEKGKVTGILKNTTYEYMPINGGAYLYNKDNINNSINLIIDKKEENDSKIVVITLKGQFGNITVKKITTNNCTRQIIKYDTDDKKIKIDTTKTKILRNDLIRDNRKDCYEFAAQSIFDEYLNKDKKQKKLKMVV